MAWISSITSTVLPTPAPPNIAALPPCTSGVSRSTTLMPVANRSVAALCRASGGGARWIGRRGTSDGSAGPLSPTAPTTSSSRPRTASPTGPRIGPPVARTRRPRASPEVVRSAMLRTVCASRCACTSAGSGSPPPSNASASPIAGSGPAPKATSTTAPRTATMRPSEPATATGITGPLLYGAGPATARPAMSVSVSGDDWRSSAWGVLQATSDVACTAHLGSISRPRCADAALRQTSMERGLFPSHPPRAPRAIGGDRAQVPPAERRLRYSSWAMYLPPQFEPKDRGHAVTLMREYPFASLVSVGDDGLPFVTHLPLHLREQGAELLLLGHVARPNPHWRLLAARPQALVTFLGAHGYIRRP